MDDTEKWLGYSNWKPSKHPSIFADPIWHYHSFKYVTTRYAVVGNASRPRSFSAAEHAFSA